MKILSVTAQKPHSTGSGVFLTELVKGFAKNGIQQAVVCGMMPGETTVFPADVKVYPVIYESDQLPFPVAGMSDEMPYRSTRYSDFTSDQTSQFEKAFLAQVKQAVQELAPDLILCHHLYLLTAMIRNGFPEQRIYGVCHGSDLRQIRKNSLKREFILRQIGKLDGIFALHGVQKEAIADIFEYGKERISVIGVGYNDTIFYPTGQRAKRPPVQLIFAGKIAEKKGVMSLLRSLNRLSFESDQIVLKLAGGSGVEAEYEVIRKLADECRYPVVFLGSLTQKQLAVHFNQSHIFILPSFYEGLPLVTVEAMACGLQVIVTDLPGVQDWLSDAAKGNRAIYVTPPKMKDTDVPAVNELEPFEERLAKAVQAAIQQSRDDQADLSHITWEGVCKRILGTIE